MAENKVSIELTIEDVAAMKSLENFSKKINRATKETGEFGKGADDAFKGAGESAKKLNTELGKSESGFGELVKGVTIANLASSAIENIAGSMKQFIMDSINGAIEAEQAINKLSQSLRASGSYSEEAVADFSAFADEMERASQYTGPQILDQISLAKSMGATNAEAKMLAQGAANLAAVFGGSLDASAKQLGQTLNGEIGKLGKLVPELQGLTKEQLRSGEALTIINEKFSGSAQAQVEGYAGKVDILSKAYGKFQEETGKIITQSSLVASSIDVITEGFFGLASVMVDLGTIINGHPLNDDQQAQMLDTLSVKFEQLTDRVAAYEKQIANFESGEMSWFEKLGFDVNVAKDKVKELTEEQRKLYEQMNASREPSADKVTPDGSRSLGPSEADIQKQKEYFTQYRAAYEEQAAWQYEQDMLKRDITAENFAYELEMYQWHQQSIIEAKYAAEEQKLAAIEDSNAKQLALESLNMKKSFEIQKSNVEAEKKLKQQQVQLEQQKQAAMAGAALAGLNLLGTIAKDGTREQFYIQKAAAIASAMLATKVAYMQALAFPPGPPATIPTASWVLAAGAANVAGIVATAIKGFAMGGIVDSSSMQGDKGLIAVNGGEVVLNQSQQQRLMDIANGNGGASSGLAEEIRELRNDLQNLVLSISIDGREIARTVKEQKDMGFVI